MHLSLTHSSRLSGRLSFCRKRLIPVVKNAVINLSLMLWQDRRQIRLHTFITGGHWLSNGCFIWQELLPTICSKHVFSNFKQMNNKQLVIFVDSCQHRISISRVLLPCLAQWQLCTAHKGFYALLHYSLQISLSKWKTHAHSHWYQEGHGQRQQLLCHCCLVFLYYHVQCDLVEGLSLIS